MSQKKVEHGTVTVERRFRASPERVFAAWSERAQRIAWDVPGEGWVIAEHEQDFKVGGREISRFGPAEDPRFKSVGVYLHIEPNRRILSAGTMHDGDVPMTTTLCTIETIPDGEGTRLLLTDQSAYFGEETVDDRKGGWKQIVDNLEAYLK